MRTLIAVAVTVLLAVVIVWSNSISRFATDATVGKATLGSSLSAVPKAIPTISIWEIHNQAHLENLPVQEIDDQSLVFSASRH